MVKALLGSYPNGRVEAHAEECILRNSDQVETKLWLTCLRILTGERFAGFGLPGAKGQQTEW
jgi:hypothetical protein